MKASIVFTGFAAAASLIYTACADGAKPVTVTVSDASSGHAVSDRLWGIFFEDINWAADGGLSPEQLANGGFDWGQADHEGWNCRDDGWEADYRGGAMARLSFQYGKPVHPNTAKHLRIEVISPGNGCGVRNRGLDGICVEEGKQYRFSIRSRSLDFTGNVRFVLEADGRVLNEYGYAMSGEMPRNAERPFPGDYVLGEWFLHEAVWTAPATATNATLSILLDRRGAAEFETASLASLDTVAGLRRDLVEKLAALKPAFVRFPGGCIVEEGDFQHWYDWRRTVGPKERRECVLNRWSKPEAPYWETFSVGYYEYFLLCEAIGAEPLPICLAGLTCQFQPPVQLAAVGDMDYFAKIVTDLVEFANGAPDTTWGRVRAEMGHPAPFGLKYIGIGNENWGGDFLDRYEAIQHIVKQRHPEITVIGSSGPEPDGTKFGFEEAWQRLTDKTCDLVDEHYYKSPDWFRRSAHRYDTYAREGKPKVYVGEYACHDKESGKANNQLAALCEAAAMTGFERNSDVVQMASYAPLFARSGHEQWQPNMIWFDGLRSMVTPSYHVQQMFSLNRPTHTMPSSDSLDGDEGTFFHSCGIDGRSGDVIVKLVSISNIPRKVKVVFAKELPAGTVTFASLSSVPAAVNTLEAPETVSPVTGSFSFQGGRELEVEMPAFSLKVLRCR